MGLTNNIPKIGIYHRSNAQFMYRDGEGTKVNMYIQENGGIWHVKYTILQDTLAFSVNDALNLKQAIDW